MNIRQIFRRKKTGGVNMHKRSKLIIVGATITVVSGCSNTPPEMPEPKGDWVSVNTLPAPENVPVLPVTSDKTIPVEIQRPTPVIATTRIQQSKPSTATAGLLTLSALPAGATHDNSLHQFVSRGGRNSLYAAVRAIVPGSWAVSLRPDVASRPITLSWMGGDQWPYVLRKSLKTEKLMPVIDTGKHLVTVAWMNETLPVPVSPAYSEPLPVSPGVQMAQKAASSNQQRAKAKMEPAGSFGNPVMLNTKSTVPVVLKTPLIPKSTAPFETKKPQNNLVPLKPVVPLLQLKKWEIPKGTTLKDGWLEWVKKEKCGIKGWTVQWQDAAPNYPIDYPLSFVAASFEDATKQLFDLWRKSPAPLFVNGYSEQCLIVVSDKPY
jgi:type IV pili sensor histidine kinase/response regulator